MSQNNSKPPMIYLKREEYVAIQMALAALMEDTTRMARSEKMPWNPEARKAQMEILDAAGAASRKIHKVTGIKATLPPYNDGDEAEFFTKES